MKYWAQKSNIPDDVGRGVKGGEDVERLVSGVKEY